MENMNWIMKFIVVRQFSNKWHVFAICYQILTYGEIFFFPLNIKDRKRPTTYLVPPAWICHWLAFIDSSKAILLDYKVIFSLEENETFKSWVCSACYEGNFFQLMLRCFWFVLQFREIFILGVCSERDVIDLDWRAQMSRILEVECKPDQSLKLQVKFTKF